MRKSRRSIESVIDLPFVILHNHFVRPFTRFVNELAVTPRSCPAFDLEPQIAVPIRSIDFFADSRAINTRHSRRQNVIFVGASLECVLVSVAERISDFARL